MSFGSVAFTVIAIYCIRVALDLWDPVPIPTAPQIVQEMSRPRDDEDGDVGSTIDS